MILEKFIIHNIHYINMLKETKNRMEFSTERTYIIVYKDKEKSDLPFSGGDLELPKSNNFGEYDIEEVYGFSLMPGDIVVSLGGTVDEPLLRKAFVVVDTNDEGVFVDESLIGNGMQYYRHSVFISNFLGQQVHVYRGITKTKETNKQDLDIESMKIATSKD